MYSAARSLHLLCHISADTRDGKLHGAQLVLGLVAQQFQLRGTQIEKRGKSDAPVDHISILVS